MRGGGGGGGERPCIERILEVLMYFYALKLREKDCV